MSPWDWQDHAACRGKDPDATLFFAPDGEKYDTGARQRREERARAFCAACPVAAECLAYALTAPERYGLWAGLDEDQRAAQRRRETRNERERAARRAERAA